MKIFIKCFASVLFVYMFSSCCHYKIFNTFTLDGFEEVEVGNVHNKMYAKHELNDPDLDPNVLTKSYRKHIIDIILKHLPDDPHYLQLDYKSEVYVTLYFHPKNFSVMEVYFREIRTKPAVFNNRILCKIENDVKSNVVARSNEFLIHRQLDTIRISNSKFIAHTVGFRTRQLFELKNGDISEDDVLNY